jgi:hypothetical protein
VSLVQICRMVLGTILTLLRRTLGLALAQELVVVIPGAKRCRVVTPSVTPRGIRQEKRA